MAISESLQRAESQLESSLESLAPSDVIVSVIAVLAEFLGDSRAPAALDLVKQIEAVADDPGAKRASALFLIRCLGVPGVISENDRSSGQHLQRKLVTLVEQSAPDIADYLRLGEKKQTINKIEALRDAHRQCTELLHAFTILPNRPEEFANRRQDIFRILNNKFLKSYLNNYEFGDLSNVIRDVINGVCELQEAADATFGPKLQQLTETVQAELKSVEARSDFLGCCRGSGWNLRVA